MTLAKSKKTNHNRRAKQSARTSPTLTADQRLVNAQEIFEAIRHAVEDFEDAQTVIRSKTAVRNFVEQARSLTWALQHLKRERCEPAQWDEWWHDATTELREDKIAQWFYNLRNPIVKEGHPVEINRATALAEREFVLKGDESRPEGAENANLIMDWNMKPYWVLPDGTWIPHTRAPKVRQWLVLEGAPEDLADYELVEMMGHYTRILDRLLTRSILQFGTFK